MDKKLPSIFKNVNDRPINNNKTVYYSLFNDNQSYNREEQSKEYVFNVPVRIETNNEIINTKIVAKVDNHILTNDNRIIQLDDIKSIKKVV